MNILVQLKRNRDVLGALSLVTDGGRVLLKDIPCLGQADAKSAAAKGNPERDPLKVYGATPTGKYNCYLSEPRSADAQYIRTYGPHGVIALDPFDGAALTAKRNGRFGLLIHGGDPSGIPWIKRVWKGLRPTFGCVRVANDDMAKLLAAIAKQRSVRHEGLICTVEETLL